jgi:sodium-dependent phosphate cotransporter
MRKQSWWTSPAARVAVVVVLLFVFLVGVKGLGDGFKLLGRDVLDTFFAATENPFLALMVGILATTLMQSSSVTTAMIVGLVAAPDNPLPIANAVPMIMGANIGTTVTNTIVSLAHLGRRREFVRAFSVATCHDFFNYIAVAVLLPLELATGYLRSVASYFAVYLQDVGGVTFRSPLDRPLKAALVPIKSAAEALVAAERGQALVIIGLSAVFIFAALMLVVRTMRTVMESRVEAYVTRALGRSVLLAVLVGIVVTVMVQSSSITTSLLVPLAGAGLLTVHQAFPVTVGANIGTTITALLASLAVSGEHAQAGLTIALVHLLFNLTATVMILPVPAVRRIPPRAAERLAEVAAESRRWALLYVLGLFYALPAALAVLGRMLR